MTILEKFSDENLFEEMNKIQPLPWNDYIYVNMVWLKRYGQRNILLTWIDAPVNEIAQAMLIMCYNRWKLLFDNVTNNILANGNKATSTTRTVTDNNVERETNNNSIQKTSAYDVEDFSDKNSSSDTTNLTETYNNDKKEVIESTGKAGNFTNDFLAFNSFLTKTNFFDMVYTDINDVLTVKVLECDI